MKLIRYLIFVLPVLFFSVTAFASADDRFDLVYASVLPGVELDFKSVSRGGEYGSSVQDAADINEQLFSVSESLKYWDEMSSEQGKFTDDRAVQEVRDWKGIKKDTLYFLGYQFAVIGLLYVLPEDMSGWSEEQKDAYSFSRWGRNVSNPVWDKDKWYLNYIAHPYLGGAYYVRARERHFDKFDSFLYSALLSGIFEFGVEAFFEKVSVQDVIITPVAGSLVGMMFEKVRENIKSRDRTLWYDDLILFLTDPLGGANNAVDRWLGINASVEIKSAYPVNNTYDPFQRETLVQYDQPLKKEPEANFSGVELKIAW